jgi:hypothetical protein
LAARRRLRRAAPVFLLAALTSVLAASSLSQASTINVSGTWTSVYHCKTGGCAGQNFPSGPSTLVQAAGSSTVTSGDGKSTGTLVGHTLTLHGASPGYSYKATLTISADGKSWTGKLSDSNGTSGTDTGTRLSGPEPNVTGNWDTVYHCQIGCAGQTFSDLLKLKQAAGSTTVTGTDALNGSITGTLSVNASNQITLVLKEIDGSYTANFNVTITVNGKAQSWSGTVSDSNGTSGTDTATLEGPPVLGQSGMAAVVAGTVTIETPGQTSFSALSGSSSIPMGSTIDATAGTVKLTVAKAHGKGMQTGEFYSGEFKLTQSHSGLTKETLEGGTFTPCPAGGGPRLARAASAAKGTPTRQLWGHAHGSFSTSGRGGAATVLGTIWLTQDYCNGTLFKAVKDSITVVTFAQPHKKHHIAQGHSFFAALSGA